MPQLAKGGKNAFAWSKVSATGKIPIPLDAFAEYHFVDGEKAILVSGSKKSGGFGLTTLELLKNSIVFEVLSDYPSLIEYQINEGEPIKINSKVYCWTTVDNKSIKIPISTLQLYGIGKGDSLLTVRGSNLALGFIVRGPIVEEAIKHPELEIYT
jgi:hypothetical protein